MSVLSCLVELRISSAAFSIKLPRGDATTELELRLVGLNFCMLE